MFTAKNRVELNFFPVSLRSRFHCTGSQIEQIRITLHTERSPVISFSMMVHSHGMEPLMTPRSRKVDPKVVFQLAVVDCTSQIDQIHITRHTERSPVMSFSMMVHLHGIEPLMAPRSRKVDPKVVFQLALVDCTSQIDQIHITLHTETLPVMSFSIMVCLHGIDPQMTPWSRKWTDSGFPAIQLVDCIGQTDQIHITLHTETLPDQIHVTLHIETLPVRSQPQHVITG